MPQTPQPEKPMKYQRCGDCLKKALWRCAIGPARVSARYCCDEHAKAHNGCTVGTLE